MKNILRAPSAKDAAGAPPVPTIADLQAQLDAANKTIADLQAAKAMASEDEKLIVLKMSTGLTRSQAISVITRQRQYDASEIGKARAAKVAKAAKS
jgi:hypothetical protein